MSMVHRVPDYEFLEKRVRVTEALNTFSELERLKAKKHSG